VLAVSRPDPPLRYALPGGGANPGESYEQAARRELYEETGIIAGRLVRVYEETRGRTHVVAFFDAGSPSGRLWSSSEGWARWVDPRVVTCPGAAWHGFARAVFAASGLPVPGCM
jgi:8-oxo-dGTP pyrophosphatase MutT (NUDIX family)